MEPKREGASFPTDDGGGWLELLLHPISKDIFCYIPQMSTYDKVFAALVLILRPPGPL